MQGRYGREGGEAGEGNNPDEKAEPEKRDSNEPYVDDPRNGGRA